MKNRDKFQYNERKCFEELNIQNISPIDLIKINAFLTCYGIVVDIKFKKNILEALNCNDFEWRTGHIGIPIFYGKSINMDIRTLCSISKFDNPQNVPLSLSFEDKNWRLLIWGKPYVDVELNPIPLQSWHKKKTKTGVPYNKILQNDFGNLMGTIPNEDGYQDCYYYSNNEQCFFCSLERKKKDISPNEYAEIISEAAYEYPNITVTLTGGNSNSENRGIELYLPYIHAIRNRNPKVPIEIEASPPKNMKILDKLLHEGVTSFTINLEIFDDIKRKRICPGKGKMIPKEDYIRVFEWARENQVLVYSVLIVGLESSKSFLEGVDILSKMGVIVNPLPFKPFTGSIFENMSPVSPIQYLTDSINALDIMKKNGINLDKRKNGGCGACGGCSIEVNLDRNMPIISNFEKISFST